MRRAALLPAAVLALALSGCNEAGSAPKEEGAQASSSGGSKSAASKPQKASIKIEPPTDCAPFSGITVPASLGGGSIQGGKAYAGMLQCTTAGEGPTRVDVWIFDTAHVPNAEEKALIEASGGNAVAVMTENLGSYERYAAGLTQNPLSTGVTIETAEVEASGWNFGIAWTGDRANADSGLRYDGWVTFGKVAGDQALTCSYNSGLGESPASLSNLNAMAPELKDLCDEALAAASR